MHVVWSRKNQRVPDPTPAEIKARAKEVRAKWSAADREQRNAYAAPAYVVPVIAVEQFVTFEPATSNDTRG